MGTSSIDGEAREVADVCPVELREGVSWPARGIGGTVEELRGGQVVRQDEEVSFEGEGSEGLVVRDGLGGKAVAVIGGEDAEGETDLP